MYEAKHRLSKKIQERQAAIGVIGMGYVGLPLGLSFAAAGFGVTGFETDGGKVASLRAGRSYIRHIQDDHVASAVASGRLKATTDFDQLAEQDVIIICVPTPLTKQREPDTSFVREAAREIAGRLRMDQLVVLESTTYPGTTDELLREILEGSGMKLGEFLLAFSPEREDPGNAEFNTRNIPKLVGGVDVASGDAAQQLYAAAIDQVVRVSNARTAEAAKLTENIFRGVNIALVNELKIAFDKMDIDIWEVLDAASTKPFGFMRFSPGPGWGGHCIPIDPFYMSWKAREYEVTTRFIEHAGEINVRMPDYVIGKLQNALNQRGKAINGARVLLLGVAYKNDIDDCRESPVFPIIEKLAKLGARVSFHDPYVALMPRTLAWPDCASQASERLDAETLLSADAVVIVTAHGSVDYELVERHAALIVDTRGVYRGARANVVKA